MKTQLSLDEKELARLESIKPHDYADKLPQLNRLFQQSYDLEGRFAQEFDQYADALSGTLSEKKLTKPQTKYYQQLSQYLARRLGKVRHIDREHSVKAVDLIRKEIRTENDKIIPFIRMGTGQSQSTYITSLLSTPDKRKIIALFDEVAMMDDTSLGAVFDKLKELYDSDRLLCGVVVQKANSIKVTSKV
jgi:exonuclease SbcC